MGPYNKHMVPSPEPRREARAARARNSIGLGSKRSTPSPEEGRDNIINDVCIEKMGTGLAILVHGARFHAPSCSGPPHWSLGVSNLKGAGKGRGGGGSRVRIEACPTPSRPRGPSCTPVKGGAEGTGERASTKQHVGADPLAPSLPARAASERPPRYRHGECPPLPLTRGHRTHQTLFTFPPPHPSSRTARAPARRPGT